MTKSAGEVADGGESGDGKRAQREEEVNVPLMAVQVGLAWAAAGFITGLHLYVLSRWVGATPDAAKTRKWLWFHLVAIWLMFVLFSSLGVVSRSFEVDCSEGVNTTQSRDCFFEQGLDYKTAYFLHFVGLAYIVVHWGLDLVQIPSWIRSVKHAETPKLFFTKKPLSSRVYFVVLVGITVAINSTWTTYDWSTDRSDSQNILAVIIIAEIIVGVAAGVVAIKLLPSLSGGEVIDQ